MRTPPSYEAPTQTAAADVRIEVRNLAPSEEREYRKKEAVQSSTQNFYELLDRFAIFGYCAVLKNEDMDLLESFSSLCFRLKRAEESMHGERNAIADALYAGRFIASAESGSGLSAGVGRTHKIISEGTCSTADLGHQHDVGLADAERFTQVHTCTGLNRRFESMSPENEPILLVKCQDAEAGESLQLL
jgi:hypothetical protein